MTKTQPVAKETLNLTPADIRSLGSFLSRCSIQGAEALIFVNLLAKLGLAHEDNSITNT